MKNKLLLLLLLITLIQSCDKSDYIQKSDLQETNGFIYVKIVGMTESGYSIDESFKADKTNPGNYTSYYEIYNNTKEFNIIRFTDALKYPSNYVSLEFNIDEDNNISEVDIDIDFNKFIDDDKLLDLYISNYNDDVEITDLKFSESTGSISAKFQFTYIFEDSKVLYVSGNFDLKVIQKIRK